MKLYDYVTTDIKFEITDKKYDKEGNVTFTISYNGVDIDGVYPEQLRVIND